LAKWPPLSLSAHRPFPFPCADSSRNLAKKFGAITLLEGSDCVIAEKSARKEEQKEDQAQFTSGKGFLNVLWYSCQNQQIRDTFEASEAKNPSGPAHEQVDGMMRKGCRKEFHKRLIPFGPNATSTIKDADDFTRAIARTPTKRSQLQEASDDDTQ
jgi:hypothetical protein